MSDNSNPNPIDLSNDPLFEDLLEFLDENFSPIKFSNSLILATNNPNEKELDLHTPMKRIGYDIDDINKKIEKLSQDNYSELIEEAEKLSLAESSLHSLKPSLNHVTISYNRLKSDLIDPYYAASVRYETLKKIQATSSLLRGIIFFIQTFIQLETSLNDIKSIKNDTDTKTLAKSANTLLKATQVLLQLENHLVMNPSLQSLQLIRNYEPVINMKEKYLLELSQSIVSKSSTTNSDINTSSSSNISSNSQITKQIETIGSILSSDKSSIATSCLTLYIFSSERLIFSISKIFKIEIEYANQAILRLFNSTGTNYYIDSTKLQLIHQAQSIVRLSNILNSIPIPKQRKKQLKGKDNSYSTTIIKTNAKPNESLLTFILHRLSMPSLISRFWNDVATVIGGKAREIGPRNGSLPNSLKSHASEIRDALKAAVVLGGDVNENGVEVTMVVNSLIALGKGQ